jgi:hypothetical protein
MAEKLDPALLPGATLIYPPRAYGPVQHFPLAPDVARGEGSTDWRGTAEAASPAPGHADASHGPLDVTRASPPDPTRKVRGGAGAAPARVDAGAAPARVDAGAAPARGGARAAPARGGARAAPARGGARALPRKRRRGASPGDDEPRGAQLIDRSYGGGAGRTAASVKRFRDASAGVPIVDNDAGRDGIIARFVDAARSADPSVRVGLESVDVDFLRDICRRNLPTAFMRAMLVRAECVRRRDDEGVPSPDKLGAQAAYTGIADALFSAIIDADVRAVCKPAGLRAGAAYVQLALVSGAAIAPFARASEDALDAVLRGLSIGGLPVAHSKVVDAVSFSAALETTWRALGAASAKARVALPTHMWEPYYGEAGALAGGTALARVNAQFVEVDGRVYARTKGSCDSVKQLAGLRPVREE